MAENGLFPVSLGRHRNRYWRRCTSYHFTRGVGTCPIVISEIPHVAASFPIAFQPGEDSFEPVALLSVAAGLPSPFVDPGGRWLAHYVPSGLRCYPFRAGSAGEDCEATAGRSRLMIDESSGLVTRDPQDNPFFTSDGRLTQDLCEVRNFLQNRQAAMSDTRRLCTIIAEMDLFEPLTEHDEVALPNELWGIDTRRLEQLPDAYTLTLNATGALWLIHAHQISLSHCAWLSRAQRLASSSPDEPNDSLGGFIAAMAEDAIHNQQGPEVIHAMV